MARFRLRGGGDSQESESGAQVFSIPKSNSGISVTSTINPSEIMKREKGPKENIPESPRTSLAEGTTRRMLVPDILYWESETIKSKDRTQGTLVAGPKVIPKVNNTSSEAPASKGKGHPLCWGTLVSVVGFGFTFWGFGCVPFSSQY